MGCYAVRPYRVRHHEMLRSAILCVALLAQPTFGADAVNMELSRLVADDQSARRAGKAETDWESIRVADATRRSKVRRMLSEGSIKAPIDYENAALILQHGDTTEDFRLAHSMATTAVALEPERRFARWLQAATWDRLLISLGRLQWYGTQRRVNPDDGDVVMLPIDPEVTNAHRLSMGQPAIESLGRP